MTLTAPSSTEAALLGGVVERPRSIRDQIYDRLRTAILSGEMAPGTPVVEATIAAQLGASRTPVREALRRLESEELIERRGARGNVVRKLRFDDVDCIFEIRESLESLAARRAARRMSPGAFAELEALVARMRASVDDAAEMENLDTTFHDRILAHADGHRLKRMLGDLRADILPWRFISLATRERRLATIGEHETMLAAMKSGDESAIRAATSDHIGNARRAVKQSGAPA